MLATRSSICDVGGGGGSAVAGLSKAFAAAPAGAGLAAAVAFGPGEGPIEVRLAPCGSAVGRVVDPDGQPLAGARIGISLRDRGGEQIPLNIGLWPSGEFFSADDQGRFRIEGLTPDLIARLSARPRSRPDVFLIPEGAKRAAFEHLEAKPGETVELGEIPMKRPPNG